MPPGEGGLMPEEAVFYEAVDMIREGDIYGAWLALTSMDCYLRSQDWAGLVGRDVFDDR